MIKKELASEEIVDLKHKEKGFDDFMEQMIRLAGASCGVPYDILTTAYKSQDRKLSNILNVTKPLQ
jgi:hypothetical protein